MKKFLCVLLSVMMIISASSLLAFAKEDNEGNIIQVALTEVDESKVRSNTWYGIDLVERKGVLV